MTIELLEGGGGFSDPEFIFQTKQKSKHQKSFILY